MPIKRPGAMTMRPAVKGAARGLARLASTGAALVLLSLAGVEARAAGRLTLNLNPDWRFLKDAPPGAAAPGFDDRAWSVVSLPHTYNDTDTFDDWSMPGPRGG